MPHSNANTTISYETIIPIPSYISINSLTYIKSIIEEGFEDSNINLSILDRNFHLKNIKSSQEFNRITHQITLIFNDHNISHNMTTSIDTEFIEVPIEYIGVLLGPQGKNLLSLYHNNTTNSIIRSTISIPNLFSSSPQIPILKDLQKYILKIPKFEELTIKEEWISMKDSINSIIRYSPLKLQEILYRLGTSMLIREDHSFTLYGRKKEILERCVGEIALLSWEYKEILIEDHNRALKESAINATLMAGCSCSIKDEDNDENSSTIRVIGNMSTILLFLNKFSEIASYNDNNFIFDIAIIRREAEESREFASGKKDGKILKITRETGTHIGLSENQTVNSFTTFYDIKCSLEQVMGIDVNLAIGALEEASIMVDGELPCEIAFHIPEIYHKRLIGHGGKNIQKVMKQWAVYVKFLNLEQSRERACRPNSSCSGYRSIISEDLIFSSYSLPLPNVIIRTPTKNGIALNHSSLMIQKMIEEFDDYEEFPKLITRVVTMTELKMGIFNTKFESYICLDSGRILIEGNENEISRYGSESNVAETPEMKTEKLKDDIFEFFEMAILSSSFSSSTSSSRSNSITSSPFISNNVDLLLGGNGGGVGGDFDDISSPPLGNFDKVVGGGNGKRESLIGLGNALASPLLKDMNNLPGGTGGYQSISTGNSRASPLQSFSCSADSLHPISSNCMSKRSTMEQLINIDWNDLSKEQVTRRICSLMGL